MTDARNYPVVLSEISDGLKLRAKQDLDAAILTVPFLARWAARIIVDFVLSRLYVWIDHALGHATEYLIEEIKTKPLPVVLSDLGFWKQTSCYGKSS